MPRRLKGPVLASVAVLEGAARLHGGRAADAAARARESLTPRRLAFATALVAAFAIPFAAGALGGETAAPAPATVLEPPAAGRAPESPALSAVL